jgi:hypothetical protein
MLYCVRHAWNALIKQTVRKAEGTAHNFAHKKRNRRGKLCSKSIPSSMWFHFDHRDHVADEYEASSIRVHVTYGLFANNRLHDITSSEAADDISYSAIFED